MTISIEQFDSDELYALARLALERNDVEGALSKLKKIIGVANPPAEALGLSARVYAQLGLFERAAKLYERYLQANPKAYLEQFQLGMTRFDAGKPDEALRVWAELLKEKPNYPPALFYSSLALSRTGKTMEARSALERLLKSVDVDNLYFARGKELLQVLESGGIAEKAVSSGRNGSLNAIARGGSDPYRTEH